MRYHLTLVRVAIIKNSTNNFPSVPVVKTLHYQCMKHMPQAMWPKIKNKEMKAFLFFFFFNSKCQRGFGEKEILLHYWWECRLVQPLWRTV